MASVDRVRVEVAYALPREQVIIVVAMAPGTSLRDAILCSGICRRFPEIDPDHCPVGVFGQLRDRAEAVRDGDRVEIYRPLTADPRESRRKRAAGAED